MYFIQKHCLFKMTNDQMYIFSDKYYMNERLNEFFLGTYNFCS